MKNQPMILHIDLGNQSLYGWVKENNYIIFSELVRYAEKLIKEDLEEVQALMISNLLDNIVFLLRNNCYGSHCVVLLLLCARSSGNSSSCFRHEPHLVAHLRHYAYPISSRTHLG
jgi:hypothetical protein